MSYLLFHNIAHKLFFFHPFFKKNCKILYFFLKNS